MSRAPQYGSDVVVEMLQRLDIPYVAFNPGSSFRGLHDSLVNYGDNHPEVIQVCHEEIAVALAHGYAKAAGRPMAVALHNIVGLQHASMAIFNAFCDRVPILLLGGTGPVDVNKRRPWIDWTHTALVQGNQVRDYVKWDDQPATVGSIPESLLRAYRTALAPPQGPVYVCFDVDLQEAPIAQPLELPEVARYPLANPGSLGAQDLENLARGFLTARRPAIVADLVGREPAAFQALLKLVDLAPAPVLDPMERAASLSFPTQHPLFLGGANAEVLAEADFVLALEVEDLYGQLFSVASRSGGHQRRYQEGARIIHLGVKELQHSSWAALYERLQPDCTSYTVPVGVALPQLVAECRRLLGKGEVLNPEREAWNQRWRERHQELRRAWQEEASRRAGEVPLAPPWVADQVYRSLKGHDWVLANGTMHGWVWRLWEFQGCDQYLGRSGGGGLGYGIGASLGAALAYRGSGRVVVDLQEDGDFLYCPAALWTAAHYRLPLLVVIYNNRTYFNSENHQMIVARARGRDVGRAGLGTWIRDPEVDYAALARSFGVQGFGPVERPEDLGPALAQALAVVQGGRPALVDVVTQNR